MVILFLLSVNPLAVKKDRIIEYYGIYAENISGIGPGKRILTRIVTFSGRMSLMFVFRKAHFYDQDPWHS